MRGAHWGTRARCFSVLLFAVFASVLLAVPQARASWWKDGPDMLLSRNNTDAAKDNLGRVYIPGGYSQNIPQSSVMRFDETAWQVLDAELNTARGGLAVAADAGGRIYAIGGYDNGSVVLSSVERYDPSSDSWEYVSDLPFARRECHAVTDSSGKIWVVGGWDSTDTFLRSVQIYDPDTDSWSDGPDMVEPRYKFGLAIDSLDRIYAIGGERAWGDRLSSVERYDPANGYWEILDDEISSARQVGVAVRRTENGTDYIYAIGGYSYTSEVERFNTSTGQWESSDWFTPINQARNNMAGILSDATQRIYIFGGDASYVTQTTVEYLPIPEPAGLALAALGVLGLLVRWKQKG